MKTFISFPLPVSRNVPGVIVARLLFVISASEAFLTSASAVFVRRQTCYCELV